jgi:hypothetical protein
MTKRLCIVTALILAVSVPTAAEDQTTARPPAKPPAPSPTPTALPSRVFINVNGGFQSSELSFGDTRSDPWFGETATWTADYRVKSGPQFDVGGGVRVWRNLVAQASYARFEDSRVAAIAGHVPHPFFFDRPRAISGESAALKQQEDAIHIGAMWTLPVARHFDVSVFGGPSVYRLERDLVADVTYGDEYPYDIAAFGGASVESAAKTGVGFHVGADATWLFTRSVGVGGVVRFTRATLELDSPANAGTVSLDLGGLQFGGGLRLRFGNARTKVPPSTREPAKRVPVQPEEPRAHSPSAPAGTQLPPDDVPRPSAARPQRPRTTTTLKVSAPVFVLPDASRTPLAVLPAGTYLKVREESGEWLTVEFPDPRWGPRVGYVLKKNCDW